jgi:hypothetical protein
MPSPRSGNASLDLFHFERRASPKETRPKPLPPRLPSPEQLATLSDADLSELTALLVEELQHRVSLATGEENRSDLHRAISKIELEPLLARFAGVDGAAGRLRLRITHRRPPPAPQGEHRIAALGGFAATPVSHRPVEPAEAVTPLWRACPAASRRRRSSRSSLVPVMVLATSESER